MYKRQGYTLLTKPLFVGALDSSNRDVTITACNNAGFALPFTGSAGFTAYFLFAAPVSYTHLGEQQRKPLYRERRDAEDEAYKTQCSAEIDRQTAALREKRRELALCRRILEDVPLVSRQVQQAEAERQEDMKKEVRKHEYQR